jgi:uncharacterized small protein (TIGR04563 family)
VRRIHVYAGWELHDLGQAVLEDLHDGRRLHAREKQLSLHLGLHAGCRRLPVALERTNERRSKLMTGTNDKRKQSLYFPETALEEIKAEAQRLERSLSWVVQRAWKEARLEIKALPGTNDSGA